MFSGLWSKESKNGNIATSQGLSWQPCSQRCCDCTPPAAVQVPFCSTMKPQIFQPLKSQCVNTQQLLVRMSDCESNRDIAVLDWWMYCIQQCKCLYMNEWAITFWHSLTLHQALCGISCSSSTHDRWETKHPCEMEADRPLTSPTLGYVTFR